MAKKLQPGDLYKRAQEKKQAREVTIDPNAAKIAEQNAKLYALSAKKKVAIMGLI